MFNVLFFVQIIQKIIVKVRKKRFYGIWSQKNYTNNDRFMDCLSLYSYYNNKIGFRGH